MKALTILLLLQLRHPIHGLMIFDSERNVSDVAIALAEIINALKPMQLAILAAAPKSHRYDPNGTRDAATSVEEDGIHKDFEQFVRQLNRLYLKAVVFDDQELFCQFVEATLLGAIESVNLIFRPPQELSQRIQQRRLAHRLSLFIFYWGARYPPKRDEIRFAEPIRAVVVTRPRQKAFRIYYNQAMPDGLSHLRLINWYDGDNLGLQKVPLLPSASTVYRNFKGRVFHVPVFHSPPWFWVNYNNESNSNSSSSSVDDYEGSLSLAEDYDFAEVNVTGGRDHRLLHLLAEHMNFQFVYVDAPGRTQGSLRTDVGEENESFTGGIGLLQNGLADFLLGDVSLSWERRKAIEFSFFTLADSGAFATHAPRRLNEAFAIIRPFKLDVWPYLILTVLFSGPIFYAIIAIPYKWQRRAVPAGRLPQRDIEMIGELKFHMVYVREITMQRRRIRCRGGGGDGGAALTMATTPATTVDEMPRNLFDRCIWFTVQLFLKQSCQELYHGYRAKFLMIVYWIAATYVLADVYSAQLTSQFARPPHEAPINTLQRLQAAMLNDGYRLYVEKESSSLEMLENGTEIFRQLYALMKQQQASDAEGYLIDSVESGIQLIADGLENKAVLAGRETLYFNIQQFGSKTFQLSQKLYTRYSAVAVQIGCPFLDSLNDVLIHLFEGGILDKMTNAEYAQQSRMIFSKENGEQALKIGSDAGAGAVAGAAASTATTATTSATAATSGNGATDGEAGSGASGAAGGAAGGAGGGVIGNNDAHDGKNGKNDADAEAAEKSLIATQVIQPLNLRMLQGAFIVLLVGYGAAGIILFMEWLCLRLRFTCVATLGATTVRKWYRGGRRRLWKWARHAAARVLR